MKAKQNNFILILLIIPIIFMLLSFKSCNGLVPASDTEPDLNPLDTSGSPDTWTGPGDGWDLKWEDTFDGTDIDTSIWTHEIGGLGWGNNELQYYTNSSENSFIEDDKLVIKAIKNNGEYTSARMVTKDRKYWKYGIIAARIKLPFGQGIWPAFWMLGQNIGSVGWPACGEIDILEMIGGGEDRDDTAHAACHWDNGGHVFTSSSKELPDPEFLYEDYHYFEIEWNSTNIIARLDGVDYPEFDFDITVAQLSEFHEEFFIILNMAVGGNWPGYPNDTTIFPQYMYIDWVKVYQLTE